MHTNHYEINSMNDFHSEFVISFQNVGVVEGADKDHYPFISEHSRVATKFLTLTAACGDNSGSSASHQEVSADVVL
jgi:hypothetical protein